MHLIHSKTLVLKNFFDERVPAYAILSHTWGGEELSYQQFNDDRSQKHPGWKKVWDSCRLAQMHGIDWVWIDTCCIDKTSSAELSEAINSSESTRRPLLRYLHFLLTPLSVQVVSNGNSLFCLHLRLQQR